MESKKAKDGKKLAKRKGGTIRAKSDFFRTARYGLTLQEHRIIYYAILKGQQDGTPFAPVTLAVKDFMELCEVKGKGYYSIIRDMTKKLNMKAVEVAYKDADGLHLLQAPWLTGITYHAKSGQVVVELNKKLQPFFEGKPFTETEFYFLVKFTSQYAERLYELIKALSHKPVIDFEIDDLRKRLAVLNGKYQNYNDLKRYVLDPAVRDISEYTDLEVTMSEARGRYNKVETVYFAIKKKAVPKLVQRVEQGEFQPPLSDEEQEIFMRDLLGDPLPDGESSVGDELPIGGDLELV